MLVRPSIIMNVAQQHDALEFLRSLPNACSPLVFFDPQHRTVLNHLKFGNEGARQRGRAALPAMSDDYINRCYREIARVLPQSGYLMLWADTFRLGKGDHLRIEDILPLVDIIAWDSQRMGMGNRARECGDYLLALQKPPKRARSTWHDHGIRRRWPEKVDRKIHTHIKPIRLISRVIGAVTKPGDLVVDPAAGSFVVMHAALRLGRNLTGCDLIEWGSP